MHEWLGAFLLSFGVIFVAELGDKSQLMALAFATRYRVGPVLIGITVATSLVHAVSVAIGFGLGATLPTRWILLAGGLAFLGFALWTLRGDELSESEQSRARRCGRSAVVAASFAFFLAELGDKTMLATITLATQHGWFGTWLGSTVGMVVADGLAIGVGRLIGQRLPQRVINYVAVALFTLFGAWLLLDAAGGFAGLPPWVWLASALNHHVAGWIALGIGLATLGAGWWVHRRSPRPPVHGAGPGPYRAPRNRHSSRLTGSLLALSVLLGLAGPVLVAADVIEPIPLLTSPGWVMVGAGVMLLGVTLVLAAQVELGSGRRRGAAEGAGPKLVTGGMHGRVRNPGLTGLVVAMAGSLLMAPTALAVVATVLLVVAVQLQVRRVFEPDLASAFGADYAEYRDRTGRFLPRLGQRIGPR